MSSTLLSRSLNDARREDRRDERKPYNRPTVTSAGSNKWSHDMYSGRDDDGEGGDRRRDQSRVKGRAVDKLFVDQLHYEVSELELETLFSQVGRLAYKPRIWFDKSGRSLGKATVKYERVSDAVRAIELFDGCPAKGQNIRIEFDYKPDKPEPGSLAARLAVPPAASSTRRDRDRDGAKSAPSSAPSQRGGRPPRGTGRGGGAGGRDGGARRGPPKSADDLDRELEAFMAADDTAPAAKANVDGDVEMS